MASTLFVVGDNVRITELASSPNQGRKNIQGRVINVGITCATGIGAVRVDWQNGSTTEEVPTNLDNLSKLGQPNNTF